MQPVKEIFYLCCTLSKEESMLYSIIEADAQDFFKKKNEEEYFFFKIFRRLQYLRRMCDHYSLPLISKLLDTLYIINIYKDIIGGAQKITKSHRKACLTLKGLNKLIKNLQDQGKYTSFILDLNEEVNVCLNCNIPCLKSNVEFLSCFFHVVCMNCAYLQEYKNRVCLKCEDTILENGNYESLI